MDYNSLKKDELLAIVKEQKHLAKAVEAKDKEIAALKRKLSEVKEAKATMVSREQYDKLSETLKSYQGSVTKEKLEEVVNKLDGERRLAVDNMVQYKQAYEDLLRVFKVNLDIAINTNDLLSSRFKMNKKE